MKGSSVRTSTAAGPNPTWNQQLELKYRSANRDFSSGAMSHVRDNIHLHLFDEVNQFDSLQILQALKPLSLIHFGRGEILPTPIISPLG